MRTYTQLKFVRLLISLTIVAALLQLTGVGQSKKRAVVAAPLNANTSAQMLRASLSRTGNIASVPLRFVSRQFALDAINPSGLFLPVVKYGSGGNAPVSVKIADVNVDGKPDLVVANVCESFGCSSSSEGGVGVLLGNGDGTFRPALSYGSGGIGALSVAVADVNGDGKPDLVVGTCLTASPSCGSGQTGGVAISLGNGDGTFQSPTTYISGGWGADSVAVADVNGDGKPDLLVTNFYDPSKGFGSVGVLLGNGDGTFQPVVTYSSNLANVSSVVVADVNGDGKPDLLLAGGFVIVLLGNGDGTFQPARSYVSTTTASIAIAVADVNGDGQLDVITANSGACANCASSVGVLLGNGDGSFRLTATYDSGGGFADSVAVVDVNGDGKMDAVVANCSPDGQRGCDAFTNGVVGVLLGNGDGTFQPVVTFDAGGPNVESVAAGDLRRSGRPDLVTTSFFQSSVVGVLLNNTGTKSSTSTILTSSLNPSTYGQKATWTATVTSSGTIAPTGKVKFTWSGYTIGSATLNSSGVATLTRSNLNADIYPLVAVYVGDASDLGSTSAVLNQVVLETTSAATLTSSANPSTQGEAVTFTAKVTSPTVKPTGPVTFTVGKTVLGTAQLIAGRAMLTISPLAVGSTRVTATYHGDSNIAKSSASVIQTVQ